MFVTQYLLAAYRFRRQGINSGTVEFVLRSIYSRAEIVGDKWPGYVYRLDTLAGTEGLRILIIYRDCRDVVSSTLKAVRTTWRGQRFIKDLDSAEKVAQRWVRAVESMERHQEKLHLIRYENLVQDPLEELNCLGQWLNIDPSLFPCRMIRDTSVGKHTKALSRDELAKVIDVAGPTMRRLGYI